MMHCVLCREEKDLRKSHIIPEFLYAALYDEHHKYLAISTDPGKRNVKRPKGVYEKLLCEDCEQYFSKLESYASGVLFGGPELLIKNNKIGIHITGVDYEKFKLFQMSIIWRIAVSEREEFRNVSLGPHQERLREMLLSKNPGKQYEYGCVIVFSPKIIAFTQELILPPEQVKIDGHRCLRALFGGVFWLFVVSSHAKQFRMSDFYLSEKGELQLVYDKDKMLNYIKAFAHDLKRSGKLPDDVDES